MKYHALQAGPMQETGRSLLRLIQNTEMPHLDLLVREAVQNSLDAAKTGHHPVKVAFSIKNHETDAIASLLPEIALGIKRKWDGRQSLLEIRDTGTSGLTGPVSGGMGRHMSGNLVKLVYEISKPQEEKEAGGSWGLGKTVYYRMGGGIVFFYSRIETECSTYAERLAVCFVENEQTPDRVMEDTETGIAWWGGQDVSFNGRTWPSALTDAQEIQHILDLLDIRPFQNEETGTAVIIPFLRKDLLPDATNGAHHWYGGLSGYIKHALYRWYAVRLGNSRYTEISGRPRLEASVDGTDAAQGMPPLFRVIQALYSRANAKGDRFGTQPEPCEETDILDDGIEIRNTFAGEPCAGWVAAVRLSAEQLKMGSPDNMKPPQTYLLDLPDENLNLPIIGYIRKPGMIVRWNDPKWQRGLKPCEDGKYIIALFVPYSANVFSGPMCDKTGCQTIEEYLRSIENADHAGWTDRAGLNIVHRMYANAQNKINAKFFPDEIKASEPGISLARSRRLAKAFLPEDFGTGWRGSSPIDMTTSLQPQPTGANPSFHVHGLSYEQGRISMEWTLYWGKKATLEHSIHLQVATTGAPISLQQWEASALEPGSFPFSFTEFSINSTDNRKKGQNPSVNLTVAGGIDKSAADSRIEVTNLGTSVRIRNISDQSFTSWAFKGHLTIEVNSSESEFSPIILVESKAKKAAEK